MAQNGRNTAPLPASRAPALRESGTRMTRDEAASAPAAPAGFLAQLLGCRDGWGPYRAKRRAEPGVANASYRQADRVPASRRTLKVM